MAYNRYNNPDALPAHAEPEQAAQMMGPNRPSNNAPAPAPGRQHAGSTSTNYNKPVPPPPNQQQGYGRTPPPNQGYGQQPPPQQQNYGQQPPPQQSQGYNDYNRNNSPRYDNNSGSRYNQAPPPQQTQQSYYSQQAPPPRDAYGSPPPPHNYGQGPPPPNSHGRPPIPEHQRPPTVAPTREQSERDGLWQIFLQVDKDRSGQLSEAELQKALVNGDYTAFDVHTVRMMVRLFDTTKDGTINFDEFCGLWAFLASWRGLFDRFDVDRSGTISYQEFSDALVAFGYRLSPKFVNLLFGTYARSSKGRGDEGGRTKVLSFDLFVQACISLKRMTDIFKLHDQDRDGYITLSFEEFLTGALSLFLFNSISPNTDTGLY